MLRSAVSFVGKAKGASIARVILFTLAISIASVEPIAGISKSSYTSYEAGRGMPSADKVVALAHVLGTTTDELLLDPSEMTVSQDMLPILRRFEALPPEFRNQAKIALKGVLFGYEQEALR